MRSTHGLKKLGRRRTAILSCMKPAANSMARVRYSSLRPACENQLPRWISQGAQRSLTQWEAYERSVAGTSDDFLYSCQNLHTSPLYKNNVSQYIADEWGIKRTVLLRGNMLVYRACYFVYNFREDGRKASCKLLLQHVYVVFVQMDRRLANVLMIRRSGEALGSWRA